MFFASFIYEKYKYTPNEICTIAIIISHHDFLQKTVNARIAIRTYKQ